MFLDEKPGEINSPTAAWMTMLSVAAMASDERRMAKARIFFSSCRAVYGRDYSLSSVLASDEGDDYRRG